MNELERASGILLHISSLPGPDGIGTIGKEAFKWIDDLYNAGIKYWQILPLNPTGFGNSPYQGLSAFAGNPLFIDLNLLSQEGLLSKVDLLNTPHFPIEKIDFQKVFSWKYPLLRRAYDRIESKPLTHIKQDFDHFRATNETWLKDFCLFMAIREKYQMVSWSKWPDALRLRGIKSLKIFEKDNVKEIEFHQFMQFLFFRQWGNLKEYANSKGIQLIGDVPIFMGYDCADVWANPHLFQLDGDRNPTSVAGVPPDFFSDTGQLWGNPLYDWDAHKQEGYTWWSARVQETLKTVDLIRLDHFRGFAGYFRIPAGAKTAETGEWVRGPGKDLFDSMLAKIGSLPFIAEDLGVITKDVIALRERYKFPGMRLLQFAFWKEADHEFLPHNYPNNSVVYTGTHDNDTSVGWFKTAPLHEKCFCTSYLGGHSKDIAHEMITTIWRTNACIAIAPVQDFLRLGGWARMNLPATTKGNWLWRMKSGAITPDLIKWIKKINITFNRASSEHVWKPSEYFNQ